MAVAVATSGSGTAYLPAVLLGLGAVAAAAVPPAQRLVVSDDGLRIRGVYTGERIPWKDVVRLPVEGIARERLLAEDCEALGAGTRGRQGGRGEASGSRPRGALPRHHASGSSLRSGDAAGSHGVAFPFDADAPTRRRAGAATATGRRGAPRLDVTYVACGRVGPSNEMWAVGEEAGATGWYCRDEQACERRAAARAD